MTDPKTEHELHFSNSYLEAIHTDFATMILEGEKLLHRLSQLLCHAYALSYQLQSEVTGENEITKKRYTILQSISADEFYATTEISFGNQQLREFFCDNERGCRTALIANMVEYQPTEINEYGICKIRSRIKAERDLLNKVNDKLFDIDSIIKRDKQLCPLNRYIMDVFGIKIVVDEVSDAYRVQETLKNLRWSDAVLGQFNIEPRENTRQLDFIEIKDYLNDEKASKWKALKSVVHWADKTFEIQIQPLLNYNREQEHLTQESHARFKIYQERIREQVAQKISLFRFYQDLLRWLFLSSDSQPPTHEGVGVYLRDS